MKYVVIILVVVAALGLGGLLFAWSGVYNIAATAPHWEITRNIIRMVQVRSIAFHSDPADLPDFDSAQYRQAAFAHYHGMCRLCHGAPGVASAEFARGLYPSPPGLTSGKVQQSFSDAELYWIVKHGIKMTGMPAFDPTHDERELRGLVALVQEIPQMNAEQYRQHVDRAGSGDHAGNGHAHQGASNSQTGHEGEQQGAHEEKNDTH